MTKIDNLQVLRFGAAAAVVYSHAMDLAITRLGQTTLIPADSTLHHLGGAGVDIFFVLSGFIIATIARGQHGVAASGAFLWRRFKRVAPMYWLLSLPTLFSKAQEQALVPAQLIATFLFWPFSGLTISFPLLGPGWTLCFEMLFYVAFAAGIAFGGRFIWLLVAGYFAALVAGFLVEAPPLKFLGSPLILEFLLGIVIAKTWRGLPLREAKFVLALGACALLAPPIFTSLEVDVAASMNEAVGGLWRVAIWGLPAALIVLAAVRIENPASEAGPLRRALIFLGDASYAIYLVHTIVLRGFGQVVEKTHISVPGDVVVIVGVIGSIVGGALVHVCLEKPLLQLMSGKKLTWPKLPLRSAHPVI
ncbi:acyltransferase family protein [Brevundimonas sp. SL130]|uniref:acyltransferase family protein n=1 Tax=Brevundimonas sp. SL130 TaxID=2995143 RepID=UPI00226D1A18|nr:acyltransferase [Brevundimonas sp. SL130]WAC59287.1 acyltransferase [Brevundimonas sp. SL130]